MRTSMIVFVALVGCGEEMAGEGDPAGTGSMTIALHAPWPSAVGSAAIAMERQGGLAGCPSGSIANFEMCFCRTGVTHTSCTTSADAPGATRTGLCSGSWKLATTGNALFTGQWCYAGSTITANARLDPDPAVIPIGGSGTANITFTGTGSLAVDVGFD